MCYVQLPRNSPVMAMHQCAPLCLCGRAGSYVTVTNGEERIVDDMKIIVVMVVK